MFWVWWFGFSSHAITRNHTQSHESHAITRRATEQGVLDTKQRNTLLEEVARRMQAEQDEKRGGERRAAARRVQSHMALNELG